MAVIRDTRIERSAFWAFIAATAFYTSLALIGPLVGEVTISTPYPAGRAIAAGYLLTGCYFLFSFTALSVSWPFELSLIAFEASPDWRRRLRVWFYLAAAAITTAITAYRYWLLVSGQAVHLP